MQWADEDWVSLSSSKHFSNDTNLSFSSNKAMKVEKDSLLKENKSFSNSSSSSSTSSIEVKVKITFGNCKEGEEAFGEELMQHLRSRATKLLLREEWNEYVQAYPLFISI